MISKSVNKRIDAADTAEAFSTWTKGADLKEGTRIHRYQILGLIGKGGMGAVYKAYDPELDRSIAIKMLKLTPSESQNAARPKARLMREAQALAKLSHPNVVSVFDVGTYEDNIYIAMEYVTGKTLRDWLHQEKPTLTEIVRVFLDAGKGLQAAHAKGIVHRDFKPENVIVADNGLVKVLDFGLARAAEIVDSNVTCAQSAMFQEHVPGEKLLLTPLTQAGAMLGTTSYMAPEHFRFKELDEKTDQFSFCVSLFEALYGKRPFVGNTKGQLAKKIKMGLIQIPKEATVPKWVEEIVLKGLSVEKSNRFESISALLAALEHNPEEVAQRHRASRNRKLLVVLMAALTIGLPMGVWQATRYRTVQLCMDTTKEMQGVWDDKTKSSIRKAFLASEKSYAQGTWERVQRIFDNYLAAWSQMRADICESKVMRATLSEELFDLRMRCLRKRLEEVSALVTVFARHDRQIVQQAVQASSSLPNISLCADDNALRAPYPPPKTNSQQAKAKEIRRRLTEVAALEKTGRYHEGLTQAQQLNSEANALGYQPVQAQVLFQLAILLTNVGKYNMAEEAFHNAALMAGESNDINLAAKATVWLVGVVGYMQGRHEAGLSFGQSAKVMLQVARSDDKTRAELNNNLGIVFDEQGEHAKALQFYQNAFDTQERALGPQHPDVANTLNNMGVLFWRIEDNQKAIACYQKSQAIRETVLGPEHPLVATSLNNLGLVFYGQGEYAKALVHYRRAMTIWEKSLGSKHPVLAWPLCGIGTIFIDQGRPQLAQRPLERAMNICRTKTCEPVPQGSAPFGMARILLETGGDKATAIALAKQAQKVFEKIPKRYKKELRVVEAWLEKNS